MGNANDGHSKFPIDISNTKEVPVLNLHTTATKSETPSYDQQLHVETYDNSSSSSILRTVATFLDHALRGRYQQAAAMCWMDAAAISSFIQNSFSLGKVLYFAEASVTNHNQCYLCLVCEFGLVQHVLYVDQSGDQSTIRGWDIKHQGSFRDPSENGQRVIALLPSDTMLYLKITPNPKWATNQNSTIERRRLCLHWPHIALRRSHRFADSWLCLLLPPDRPYQRLVGVSSEPKFAHYRVGYAFGNSYLFLRNDGNNTEPRVRSLALTAEYEFCNTPVFSTNASRSSNYEWDLTLDDPKHYLQKTTGFISCDIDPQHPRVQQLLPSILGPNAVAMSTRERAVAIAKWVAEIPYEMPPPGVGWPATLDEYLGNRRYVECGGHALIFCALARGAGIAARRIMWPWLNRRSGSTSSGPSTFQFGSHMIAEYYDNGVNGWVAVDATTGPFDEHKQQYFAKLPFPTGACVPNAVVLEVESVFGEYNYATWDDRMSSCVIEVLPVAIHTATPTTSSTVTDGNREHMREKTATAAEARRSGNTSK